MGNELVGWAVPLTGAATVGMGARGFGSPVEVCAVGLTQGWRFGGPGLVVGPVAGAWTSGGLGLAPGAGGESVFSVDPGRLPAGLTHVLLIVRTPHAVAGPIGGWVRVGANGAESGRVALGPEHLLPGGACVVAELMLHGDTWWFGATARPYPGGMAQLATETGAPAHIPPFATDAGAAASAPPAAAPAPPASAPPVGDSFRRGRGRETVTLRRPDPESHDAILEMRAGDENMLLVHTLSDRGHTEDTAFETWEGKGGRGYLHGWTSAEPTRVKIDTRGEWSLTVLPLSAARPVRPGETVHGRDSDVLRWPDESGQAQIIGQGDGNLVMYGFRKGHERDLLVNEIGMFDVKADVRGRTVIAVVMDGEWSIRHLG